MPELKSLIIGTRGSPLALVQTQLVIKEFHRYFPHVELHPQIIKTTGDKITDRPLYDIGGKGLFCKEIETALKTKKVDFAVHSLKDMESTLPFGLTIASVLERESPEDVLISASGQDFWKLPPGSRVGTCSPRRLAQLYYYRPDLVYIMIRGNIQTRLRKLKVGTVEALVLAQAGLKRLNLEHLITMVFPTSIMLPAVGQGVIAIECRKQDEQICSTLSTLTHAATNTCVKAERQLLKTLGGTCRTPIAGYAFLNKDETITLKAMVATDSFAMPLYYEKTGVDPFVLGESVALHLKSLNFSFQEGKIK